MKKACPGPGSAGAGLQDLHRLKAPRRTLFDEPLVEALLGREMFTRQPKANTVEQEEQPAQELLLNHLVCNVCHEETAASGGPRTATFLATAKDALKHPWRLILAEIN